MDAETRQSVSDSASAVLTVSGSWSSGTSIFMSIVISENMKSLPTNSSRPLASLLYDVNLTPRRFAWEMNDIRTQTSSDETNSCSGVHMSLGLPLQKTGGHATGMPGLSGACASP